MQEFASQDATIVVGTSIDMDMTDELRVTVVAAGLDNQVSRQQKPAAQQQVRRPEARQRPQQSAINRAQGGAGVAAASKPEAQESPRPQAEKRKSQELDDYLDIPAFLRRQAD